MNKLNKAQAQALLVIIAADEQVRNIPTYRMGQALYNLIVDKVASYDEILAVENHYKWYNSLDAKWCTQYFIEHFVINGVI